MPRRKLEGFRRQKRETCRIKLPMGMYIQIFSNQKPLLI